VLGRSYDGPSAAAGAGAPVTSPAGPTVPDGGGHPAPPPITAAGVPCVN
jgi:hypothetical protein